MSFRNRKLATESIGKNGYDGEVRHLNAEGFKKVFGGIFDGIFNKEAKEEKKTKEAIRNMVENGIVVDQKNKSEMIKLLNKTFLNDQWLGEQTFATGKVKFAKLPLLLTEAKYKGAFADNVVRSFQAHLDVVKGYVSELEKQSTVLDKTWDDLKSTLDAKSAEEIEADEDKWIKMFDDALAKMNAIEPRSYFNKPKKTLGCTTTTFKKGDLEYAVDEGPSEIDALDVNEMKVLAELLIDTFDDISSASMHLYEGIGGIDYDNGGESDHWWHSIGDHQFMYDYYFQGMWDDYMPRGIDDYKCNYKEPIAVVAPQAILDLLLAHLR